MRLGSVALFIGALELARSGMGLVVGAVLWVLLLALNAYLRRKGYASPRA